MKIESFTGGAFVSAFFFGAWVVGMVACGGKTVGGIGNGEEPTSTNPSATGTTAITPTQSSATASSSTADPTAGPPIPSTPACSSIGPDGGGCSVSFNQDILQRMFSAIGTLGCAKAECHGAPSGIPPLIDVTNPSATYVALESVNTGDDLPYVNPCSTDRSASAILGNLSSPSTQGAHMPQDNPQLPDADDLATITTWVECGAPNN